MSLITNNYVRLHVTNAIGIISEDAGDLTIVHSAVRRLHYSKACDCVYPTLQVRVITEKCFTIYRFMHYFSLPYETLQTLNLAYFPSRVYIAMFKGQFLKRSIN